jgi:glycosyltransferase involved in cell wall biosynthesis
MRPWRSDQQRLIRTFAARADAVIAVADAQRDALVAAGYRPNRIRIIANAVDAAKFVPGVERSRVRDALGLRPDAVVFLLAASMRQEKRIPTFVNWIRQARCHEPSIVGVVAGRGSDSSEFRALVGDDGAVVGLGVREDVPDLLNAADVAVLTSSAEALPMVLIEAAITGLPLLATDVGDANTIVRNGETGFLVGADDCKAFVAQALALASDASLREKLGNAAQARACVLFNVPRMVGAYHDIFAELIAARR